MTQFKSLEHDFIWQTKHQLIALFKYYLVNNKIILTC